MAGGWQKYKRDGYGHRVLNHDPKPHSIAWHRKEARKMATRMRQREKKKAIEKWKNQRSMYSSPSTNLRATVVGLDRLQGNRSLSEIARGCGITPGYLSRVWAGKRVPSLDVTRRIARYLGVPIEKLTDVLMGDSDASAA